MAREGGTKSSIPALNIDTPMGRRKGLLSKLMKWGLLVIGLQNRNISLVTKNEHINFGPHVVYLEFGRARWMGTNRQTPLKSNKTEVNKTPNGTNAKAGGGGGQTLSTQIQFN